MFRHRVTHSSTGFKAAQLWPSQSPVLPCSLFFHHVERNKTTSKALVKSSSPATVPSSDNWVANWTPSARQQSDAETLQFFNIAQPTNSFSQKYVLTYAPSKGPSSACRVCGQGFAPGALRVGMTVRASAGDFTFNLQAHAECLQHVYRRTFPDAGVLTEPENIRGLTTVTPEDLDTIATMVCGKSAWKAYKTSPSGKKLLSTLLEQQTLMNAVLKIVEEGSWNLSLDNVASFLIACQSSQSSNKKCDVDEKDLTNQLKSAAARMKIPQAQLAHRILVDTCVFGATKLCSSCKSGYILFHEDQYMCLGFLDGFTRCKERSAGVERLSPPSVDDLNSLKSFIPGKQTTDIQKLIDTLFRKDGQKRVKSFSSRVVTVPIPYPTKKYLASVEGPKVQLFQDHTLISERLTSDEAKYWKKHGGTVVPLQKMLPATTSKATPTSSPPTATPLQRLANQALVRSHTAQKTPIHLKTPLIAHKVPKKLMEHMVSTGSAMLTPRVADLFSDKHNSPKFDPQTLQRLKDLMQQQQQKALVATQGGSSGAAAAAVAQKQKKTPTGDGGVPLDYELPDVEEYDLPDRWYSATLSKADVVSGKNSFYIMQVLTKGGSTTSSTTKYFLWRRWGRTGDAEKSGSVLKEFSTWRQAKDAFIKLFKEKVGVSVPLNSKEKTALEKGAPQPGLYSLVALDDTTKKKVNASDNAGIALHTDSTKNSATAVLKFDDATAKLIARMFDQDTLTETMKELEINTEKMPLGNISAATIKAARELLSSASELIQFGSTAVAAKKNAIAAANLDTKALSKQAADDTLDATGGYKLAPVGSPVWEFQGASGRWYPFTKSGSQTIEKACSQWVSAERTAAADYLLGKRPALPNTEELKTTLTFEGNQYEVNFSTKSQKRIVSSRVRAIRRNSNDTIPAPVRSGSQLQSQYQQLLATAQAAKVKLPAPVQKKSSTSQFKLDKPTLLELTSISNQFYSKIPQVLPQASGLLRQKNPKFANLREKRIAEEKKLAKGELIIPRNVLSTQEQIAAKARMLDDLEDVAEAYKIMERTKHLSGATKATANYRSMKCEMKTVDPSDQTYKMIEKYFNNTQNKSLHRDFKLKHVWEIKRSEEESRFQPWEKDGNRKLLWHGSGFSNWVRIMTNGLKIAPPEAPVSGYMFGKGIYFADMMSKSAGYCRFGYSSKETGLMALAEVALGKNYKTASSDSSLNLSEIQKKDKNYRSTFAQGQTAPDPNAEKKLPDGLVVPTGKPISKGSYNSLYHNEFIVYDVTQVKLRYLLEVEAK